MGTKRFYHVCYIKIRTEIFTKNWRIQKHIPGLPCQLFPFSFPSFLACAVLVSPSTPTLPQPALVLLGTLGPPAWWSICSFVSQPFKKKYALFKILTGIFKSFFCFVCPRGRGVLMSQRVVLREAGREAPNPRVHLSQPAAQTPQLRTFRTTNRCGYPSK